MSRIEWTDETWNPVRGCDKVSQGCKNCYAETFAERWRGIPGHPYEQGFDLRLVPEKLEDPLRWKKPRLVFVNSMSDLFHREVPIEFIAATYGAMALGARHTFQVLTKRQDRAAEFYRWVQERADELGGSPAAVCVGEFLNHVVLPKGEKAKRKRAKELVFLGQIAATSPWPLRNVWFGMSAEDQENFDKRVPELLRCPAALHFVSLEPLLGAIDMGLGRWIRLKVPVRSEVPGVRMFANPGTYKAESNPRGALSVRTAGGLLGVKPEEFEHVGLGWAIVGGESGARARECDVDAIRSIVYQARDAGVPVFVKQLGKVPMHTAPTFKVGKTRKVPGAVEVDVDIDVKRERLVLAHKKGGDMVEWPSDLRVREMPKVGGAS